MNDRDSTVHNGVGGRRPAVRPTPMVPIPIPLELVCPPPVQADPPPAPKKRRSRRRILLVAFTLAALAAVAIPWLARRGEQAPAAVEPTVTDTEPAPMSVDTTAPDPESPTLASTSDGRDIAPVAGPPGRPRPKAAPKRPRCGVFGSELCPPR